MFVVSGPSARVSGAAIHTETLSPLSVFIRVRSSERQTKNSKLQSTNHKQFWSLEFAVWSFVLAPVFPRLAQLGPGVRRRGAHLHQVAVVLLRLRLLTRCRRRAGGDIERAEAARLLLHHRLELRESLLWLLDLEQHLAQLLACRGERTG